MSETVTVPACTILPMILQMVLPLRVRRILRGW
jgi:hypothetical protein